MSAKKKQRNESLEVTGILDPDLKDLSLTEEDIDFELDALLLDPDEPLAEHGKKTSSKGLDQDFDLDLDDPFGETDELLAPPLSAPGDDDTAPDVDIQDGDPAREAGDDFVDFVLDEPLESLSKPSADSMIEDVDLVLEEPLVRDPAKTGTQDGGLSESMDFDLDDALAQGALQQDSSDSPLTESMDFELDETLLQTGVINVGEDVPGESAQPSSTDDDSVDLVLDFDLDLDVLSEGPPEEPEESVQPKEAGPEDVDFLLGEETILPPKEDAGEADLLDDVDFVLEEDAPVQAEAALESELENQLDFDLDESFAEVQPEESAPFSEEPLEEPRDLVWAEHQEDQPVPHPAASSLAEEDEEIMVLDLEAALEDTDVSRKGQEAPSFDDNYYLGDTVIKSKQGESVQPDAESESGTELEEPLFSEDTEGLDDLDLDRETDWSAVSQRAGGQEDETEYLQTGLSEMESEDEVLEIDEMVSRGEKLADSFNDMLEEEGLELRDLATTSTLEITQDPQPPDFNLDEILAQSEEEPDMEKFPAKDLSDEELVDQIEDFDLEEVVAGEEEPPGEVMDAPLPSGGEPSGLDFEEYTPAENMTGEEQGIMTPAQMVDMERIESLVVETVRETVASALERLLPGLVEDIITRELEKLREEIE